MAIERGGDTPTSDNGRFRLFLAIGVLGFIASVGGFIALMTYVNAVGHMSDSHPARFGFGLPAVLGAIAIAAGIGTFFAVRAYRRRIVGVPSAWDADRRKFVGMPLIVVSVLPVIILVPALISAYRQGDAGVHARYFAFGIIFAVTIATVIGSRMLGALRRRTLKVALAGDGPLLLPLTRRHRLTVAIVILAIAAGSVVEIFDPTVPLANRLDPILVAVFTVPFGLACLVAAMLSGPPLAIDAEGIAYPVIWLGTIGWRSIRSARIATGDGGTRVAITVDPPGANALTANYRRLARLQSLSANERPVPVDSFDIPAEDLLARIERNRGGGHP